MRRSSRDLLPCLTLLALLLASSPGCAPEGVTIRAGSRRADNIRVPDAVRQAASQGQRLFSLGGTVLYLNFDGATIKQLDTSDAVNNATFLGQGTVPPFEGDASQREQLVRMVKEHYARYDISIVTTRPTGGFYDMVVIGGTPEDAGMNYGPDVMGVSPMDCGNQMPRDISFVFSRAIAKLVEPAEYLREIGYTISHESAHDYGLPHSNDGCDMMSYDTCASGGKTFLDRKMGMQDYGAPDRCWMNSMNSHVMLLDALGPAKAPTGTSIGESESPEGTSATPAEPASDTQGPSVTITTPQAGATVTPGVVVEAQVSDASGVYGVELLADDVQVAAGRESPYRFEILLAPGAHRLTVQAYDSLRNKGSATVEVTVGYTGAADSEPPVVVITSPKANAQVQSPVQVTTEITDNVGVAGAQLFLDEALVSTSLSAQASFEVFVESGPHTITVEATDLAGNQGSASISVSGCQLAGSGATPDLWPLLGLAWLGWRRRPARGRARRRLCGCLGTALFALVVAGAAGDGGCGAQVTPKAALCAESGGLLGQWAYTAPSCGVDGERAAGEEAHCYCPPPRRYWADGLGCQESCSLGYCEGTVLFCEELGADACARQRGCAVNEANSTCTGIAQPCAAFGQQASCSAQQGCAWQSAPSSP